MGVNMSVHNLEKNPNFLTSPVDEDNENGLLLKSYYIPEEVLIIILSYVRPKDLLKLSLVCRKWCRIVRSYGLWSIIYERRFTHKPKRLPWYVFYCLFSSNKFDRNLLRNASGEEEFKYWTITQNLGDGFAVEDSPCGANKLPINVSDFSGTTSCFATSYGICSKFQIIDLSKDKLLLFIIEKHKPHVYVSEWVAGRFDCACLYNLSCELVKGGGKEDIFVLNNSVEHRVRQWEGSTWQKKELILKDYTSGFTKIIFLHSGKDLLYWRGHYGSKMAGGIVKILFDSIQPER